MAEAPISSSQAASRGGVAQALEAARSEERRLGAHASHAGAPAFVIGLEDTPELNGVRVKLEEPLFAAGAPPTEEKRWRVRRRDSSEALTMKIDNLAPEMPGVLPYLIAVGVAGAEENYAANWLDTGGGVDAPSRSLQADTGGTLLMLACLKGKAAFAKDLLERGANVNARDDDGLTALIAAVAHPEVVALLLDAGAHAHLRYSGAHATLVTGTALENAAAGGHAATEALLKERGGGGGGEGSTPRDVHALEQATLMRVLAAMMLEHSAQLGDEHAAARAAWLQGLIEANFADAADQAALASSPRFAKYGDDRLKADAWYEVAQREGQYLSKHAKFEAVVEEVAAAMPGVKEAIRQRQEAQGAVLV